MQNPRRVCARGAYIGQVKKPKLLPRQKRQSTLPRAFGSGEPGEPTLALFFFRDQRRANAVEMFRFARERSQCVCIAAYTATPGKKPVELLSQYPRPPPGFAFLRAQKEPFECLHHSPGYSVRRHFPLRRKLAHE